MNKFLLTALTFLLICSGVGMARETGLVYHEVQVLDEVDKKVDVNSVDIYTVGSTTSQTIYMDAAKTNTITLPMTTSSTNTTLDSTGGFYWWGASGWDFSIEDGNNVVTNADHRGRTPSDGRVILPTYIASISTTTYSDGETATFGTSSDWVAEAGTNADRMTWTPATTSTAAFYVGNASYTADLNLFGDGGYHVIWDASEATLEILDDATIAVGAGDDWVITHDGSTTDITGIYYNKSEVINEADVLFDGTYDISYDDNIYTLLFEDNAVLGIGGTHDGAPDYAIIGDATDCDVVPSADSKIWKWGNATNDIDMWWYGSDAADYMLWDEGAAELYFADAHIQLADDGTIIFGSGDDWTVYSDTADTLEFDPGGAGDQLYLGTAYTDAADVTWFSDTNGDIVFFDEESVIVTFEDVDLRMMDDTAHTFGDAGDGSLKYDEVIEDAMMWNGVDIGGYATLLEVISGSTEAVVASETAKHFLASPSTEGSQTITLPSAAAGLFYTFTNLKATSNLIIAANNASDFITGYNISAAGSVLFMLERGTITLQAIDTINWIIVSQEGSVTSSVTLR